MKKNDLSSPRRSFTSPVAAFTLVELLVTMALLVLLVVSVSQLVNSTASVTARDEQRLDATAEARLIFDRMGRDFDGMLRRPDVDCTAYTYNNLASADSEVVDNDSLFKRKGNDSFYFFSESDAYTTSNATAGRFSTVALVGYRIWDDAANATNSSSPIYSLERRGGKTIWDTNDTQSGFMFLIFTGSNTVKNESTLRGQVTGASLANRNGIDPTYAPIGSQTLRLEFCFVMKEKQANGTYFLPSTGNIDPKKAFGDVSAIIATIAVLDRKARAKISTSEIESATGPLKTLIDKLADGTTPDVAAQWNNTLLTDTELPRYITSNVRVFQRYYYLK